MQLTSPLYEESIYPEWADSLGLSAPQFISGTLREPRVEYDIPPEALRLSRPQFIDGTLVEPRVEYAGDPEGLALTSPIFDPGDLRDILIQYTNWRLSAEENESLQLTAPTFIAGTLL